MHATDSLTQEPASAKPGPYAGVSGTAHDRSSDWGRGDGMPQCGFEHFITEWATQHAEARD